MPIPTALSLDNVTIRYGNLLAVDRLTFSVNRGEILGLLGPNGSGKSSTLSAIAGELVPSSGTVRVGGLCPRARPFDYRRRIGLVPQELAFIDEFTVVDNLRFFGKLYDLRGTELRQRVAAVLQLVRLDGHADQRAGTCSGGVQRRLNLACALLHEPELLLLDEPTVGLDLQSREAIFDGLRQLRESGTAMVFTTHQLDEAECLCDRIAIVDHGRLVALGTVTDLMEQTSAFPGHVRLDGPHGIPAPHRRPARLESVYRELTAEGRS